MNLDDIIEKIKRLDAGGNGSNIVSFIVAFDLLYFLKENDNRERFIYDYYTSYCFACQGKASMLYLVIYNKAKNRL